MDDLKTAADAFLASHGLARPDDPGARLAILTRLFRAYGDLNPSRAAIYLEETQEIPLSFLRHACALVLRSRLYSSLPTIGELWQAARQVAGMHRQQYRAGHYISPPRDWPPEGRRHAITAGEFEPLTACARLLPSGEAPQKPLLEA